MADEQVGQVRVRVEDPRPEPDPARTGCLWIGGVLGVIAGVVVTFFAVPSILNFLFPSETIAVGETFQDSKLTIRVERVERAGEPPSAPWAYMVVLSVDARSSWSPPWENFVLVLDDDTELRSQPPLGSEGSSARVPQGESMLELVFSDEETSLAPPDSLHLEEPPVKFELPEPENQ